MSGCTELVVTNTDRNSKCRAILLFAERGRIDSVKVSAAGAGTVNPCAVARRFGRWAAVVPWGWRLGPDQSLRLHITGDGLDAIEHRIYSDRDLKFPTPPEALVEPLFDAAASNRADDITLQRVEASSIDAAPTCEIHRAAKYFRDLDLETHEILLNRENRTDPSERSYRLHAINRTANILVERVRQRFNGVCPPNHPDEAMVAYLSGLQRSIVQKSYSETSGQSDFNRVNNAYAHFGAAGLIMQIDSDVSQYKRYFSNGGPNGAFVFLFTEFALLAIESGIHETFWNGMLPGCLAAAHLYLIAHGANGVIKPRSWRAYHDSPEYIPDQSVIQRVLEDYTSMTCSDRIRSYHELLKGGLIDVDAAGAYGSHFHSMHTRAIPGS